MTTFIFARPEEGGLAYYRSSWLHAVGEYAFITWYEVDHAGNVLRMVELFSDGRTERNDIADYPDRASDYGFGTLIGTDFYDLGPDYGWPKADDTDPAVVVDATRLEFDAIWAAVDRS